VFGDHFSAKLLSFDLRTADAVDTKSLKSSNKRSLPDSLSREKSLNIFKKSFKVMKISEAG